MRYVVYFVPREGVHPHATLSDYDKLWPIMKRSVNALGHKLVHLTDTETPSRGDDAFRVAVDPATTIMSRDIAWLRYLKALPEGEQACMIEPDTILMKDVPRLGDGADLVLLRRSKPIIPGWFKLASNRAVPFFQEIVDEYANIPEQDHAFHGDVTALHRVVARRTHGCVIEWRDWIRYGFRKALHLDPILLQFKGHSKQEMLSR